MLVLDFQPTRELASNPARSPPRDESAAGCRAYCVWAQAAPPVLGPRDAPKISPHAPGGPPPSHEAGPGPPSLSPSRVRPKAPGNASLEGPRGRNPRQFADGMSVGHPKRAQMEAGCTDRAVAITITMPVFFWGSIFYRSNSP